jgi:Domain of unknown function (DUF1330)
MAAYVVFDVEIRDPERYQEFMGKVKPALAEAGARYLARGGSHKVYAKTHRATRVSVRSGLGDLLLRPRVPGAEGDPRRLQLSSARQRRRAVVIRRSVRQVAPWSRPTRRCTGPSTAGFARLRGPLMGDVRAQNGSGRVNGN